MGQLDGFTHRGMRSSASESKLICAEAKQRAHLGVWLSEHEALNQRLAGATHTRGAIHKVCDEAAVLIAERTAIKKCWHHEVCIGAIVIDAE